MQFIKMVESDQVSSYFRAAMRNHELQQARMYAGRSAGHQPEPDIYSPAIDMELVELRPGRSHDYGRERRYQNIGDYHMWQRQGQQIAVGSLTKEFGCLPWPN